jgi:GT2 family glycosyltransferase
LAFSAPVSLVVPAGRGPETLDPLIHSLARSRAAHPSRPIPPLLVAVRRDCGWSAEMDKLAEPWTSAGGAVDWLVSERGNATAMRNRAVAAVTTPWIAFLDDDVVVDPGYLPALFDLVAAPPGPIVQGIPYLCSNSDRVLARLEASNYASGLETYMRESGRLATLDGRNLVVQTELMQRFPFDEALLYAGEGQDLAARLEAAGIPMCYTEALRVYHRNRETPLALVRQKYYHGRGRAQLLRKRDQLDLPGYLRRYAVRHFAEPIRSMAARELPASEGLYRIATNVVFWTGVFRELVAPPPPPPAP